MRNPYVRCLSHPTGPADRPPPRERRRPRARLRGRPRARRRGRGQRAARPARPARRARPRRDRGRREDRLLDRRARPGAPRLHGAGRPHRAPRRRDGRRRPQRRSGRRCTSLGPMATILLYGDTVRYPAIRHEVPLEIIDPLLVAVEDGRTSILTSSLESARIAEALPDAELVLLDELGFYEMLADGTRATRPSSRSSLRAVRRWGIERGRRARPTCRSRVADKLRERGRRRRGRRKAVEARRRAKTAAELEGIRRAQRAAERGMAAGASADPGRRRRSDGRAPARRASRSPPRPCATRSAPSAPPRARPAPPDIMVVSPVLGRRARPGLRPAARPACRSRSTSGRATRRAAAGRT